jgi:hypothetical protein
VRTLNLRIRRHHGSPFSTRALPHCGGTPDLPSFHHPADQCSGGDSYRKSRRNSQQGMPLEALSCVIQEFFGCIAALFCGTPYYSYAILYGVGNRTARARSLVS